MKKIAVVLSGCGFKDGAEITESVSTLIAITVQGADYTCFAPSLPFQSTNHLDATKGDTRNTLHEAARIARGKIQPLVQLQERDFEAVVFPGGLSGCSSPFKLGTKRISVHGAPRG